MDKPEPNELRIELEKGVHRAVAVLYQYAADAITIHAIERHGLPPLSDDDNTYNEVSKAVEAAKKIWYGTL
ncbi:hypothetical protein [Variovorax sp. AFSI2.2]|uniref:hypothetical protein n=1 Tax=Variovorax sp. AFSI2.2 TaxID=3384160 RepID=UPI003EC0F23A